MVNRCPDMRSNSPAISLNTDCMAAADSSRISAALARSVPANSATMSADEAAVRMIADRMDGFRFIDLLLDLRELCKGTSVAAGARGNVADRVFLDGFVHPEIHRHLDLARRPGEPLREREFGTGLLLPDERDVEAAGGGDAPGRVDGDHGRPSSLLVLDPGEPDLLDRQTRLAVLLARGLRCAQRNDATGQQNGSA